MSKIQEAFNKVSRQNFVRPDLLDNWQMDEALPIGYGQTISQPTTVKRMLEWLYPKAGDKILDVGSGSGWTTALLSHLVGDKGHVYAVERIPELKEFGENNCRNYGCQNVSFHESGEVIGLPKEAPFDRILVSASGKHVPIALMDQLSDGGKMVIPIENDILEIEKSDKNNISTKTHPGYVFVPLITD